MPIRLNVNNTLGNIIFKKNGGLIRNYLVNENPIKKLDIQVFFANKLLNSGYNPFIEVKFKSMYSDREKRIEIVSEKDRHINIYKISKFVHFDRDAIELNRLSEEIKKTYCDNDFEINSILLFNEEFDRTFVLQQIENLHLAVKVEKI